MDITLSLVKHALQDLGGKASCSEIASQLHPQYGVRKYSEVDLTVRQIVYAHCPQHLEGYSEKPVFEALDAWDYGLWKHSKQYTDRYVQRLYRQKLINSWGQCVVTGVKVQCKASHIKPRHQCEVQEEKANVFNGLLLSPALDELFDKGWISFDDEGRILFSSKLNAGDIQRLRLSPEMKLQTVRSGHRCFLQYHRSYVFLDGRNRE